MSSRVPKVCFSHDASQIKNMSSISQKLVDGIAGDSQ